MSARAASARLGTCCFNRKASSAAISSSGSAMWIRSLRLWFGVMATPAFCKTTLAVRRIVVFAPSAMDQQVVNLPIVGVHQHRSAASAAVVHGGGAGDENGWCAYEFAPRRQFDNFESCTVVSGHAVSRYRRGGHTPQS